MARYDGGLTLELDPQDRRRVEQLLEKVAQGVADLSPFFDAVEMHMIDSLTQNFEVGGRPKRWAPLSPVTVEMKGSSAILQDIGDLKRSVNAQNTQRDKLSLQIWAGDEKATFHQFTDMNPMAQWGVTNERGMPMRPFMLFQEGDITEIEKILVRYVDDVMGGF
jgi:phage virion morphogenesis protein